MVSINTIYRVTTFVNGGCSFRINSNHFDSMGFTMLVLIFIAVTLIGLFVSYSKHMPRSIHVAMSMLFAAFVTFCVYVYSHKQ